MPLPRGAVLDGTTDTTAQPSGQESFADQHPILNGIEDAGKGLGESLVSMMSTGDRAVRKIPGIGEFLTTPITGTPADKAIQHTEQMATPANATQGFFKGAGNVAQFLIPGDAEKVGAAKLAELAPQLGKFAEPAARVLTSALASGGVNKAQGGDFSTGAELGAGGATVGEMARAAAPLVAESALNMRRVDRSFGKTPGAAILDETKGFTPGAVASSAQRKLNKLTPELEAAADKASVKPNKAKALLPAPAEEIPLHNSPDVEGQLSQPITLMQADRPMPKQLPVSTRTTPMSSHADIFPEQLPSGTTTVPSVEPVPAQGMGAGEYIGQVPGYNGTLGTPSGVLIRGAETGSGAIPSMLPNTSASLAGARGLIDAGMAKAGTQNAGKLYDQMTPMREFLSNRFLTGEPIPENVTPRDLLNLKRGFGEDFVHNWNPDISAPTRGMGRQVYSALDKELDRTVPESADLNQRISSLIPVTKRAEQADFGASTMQKALGRLGRPTGALASSLFGADEGYKHGGLKGAIAGGVGGLVVPELMASPTVEMMAARGLYNPDLATHALTGAVAQMSKRKGDDEEK